MRCTLIITTMAASTIFAASFHEYYDELEICAASAEKHFRSAHQTRNRSMVDRSGLVVFFVEHESGGAYTTMRYAEKKGVQIINLAK